MNKLASTLHDATHQVPGVPAHAENPANRKTQHSHRARSHEARAHNHTPPRVLVAWQNRIARLVGRNG